MKIGPTGSPETSVRYKPTPRNNAEDGRIQLKFIITARLPPNVGWGAAVVCVTVMREKELTVNPLNFLLGFSGGTARSSSRISM